MKAGAGGLHRDGARSIEAEEPHAGSTVDDHIGAHVELGERRDAGQPVEPARAHVLHAEGHDRDPGPTLVGVELEPRRQHRAELIGRERPVREQQVAPGHAHDPRPPSRSSRSARGVGDVYQSKPGTLEHWLTERYCLYARDADGHIRRGEIHHEPWPLQRAEAQIETCTVTEGWSIMLPDEPPLLHFVRSIDVVGWLLEG